MADVSHELGSLRLIVESPLSSKVAMFNNQAQQHQQAQLLNPFSNADGRSSPKPTFSKDEYGKPLAGSLTEARGQRANMHVMREMLELCQIIDSEGYNVNNEPSMRVIPFGELFNIYNYISDKVVGILLRARKYKYVEFEGEMLFQRRDDDVPVFLLRPIQDIRAEIQSKIEDVKRASSPAPAATTVLLDKAAQKFKHGRAGSATPNPTPPSSKPASKAPSPAPELPPKPKVKTEINEHVLTEKLNLAQTLQTTATKAVSLENIPIAVETLEKPLEEFKNAETTEQAVQAQAVPEQAVPEQVVPEQAVPEQAVPEQAVQAQAVPEQQTSSFAETAVDPTVSAPANEEMAISAPPAITSDSDSGNQTIVSALPEIVVEPAEAQQDFDNPTAPADN